MIMEGDLQDPAQVVVPPLPNIVVPAPQALIEATPSAVDAEMAEADVCGPSSTSVAVPRVQQSDTTMSGLQATSSIHTPQSNNLSGQGMQSTMPVHAPQQADQNEQRSSRQSAGQDPPKPMLGKRKRKIGNSEDCEVSKDQHCSSTDVPEIFSLVSPSFQTKLQEEILSFVRDADQLVSLQPLLATFRLSSQSISNWDIDLAQHIYQGVFRSPQSGHDAKFQEAYHYHMKWQKQCEIVPIAYHFRHWLKDYALPVLITHFSTTLPTPTPLNSPTAPGPTTQDRQQALRSIFESIAQANLRIILLMVQDSSHRLWFSKSGDLIPDVEPTQWRQLQDPAVTTEYAQAKRVTDVPPGKAPPYGDLVQNAVASFSVQHLSLMRQLVTHRQETAETTRDMHPRWSSVNAFLQDADEKQKLVFDDGAKQLQLELKKLTLGPVLKVLKHNSAPVKVQVSKERRSLIVQDIYVLLGMAHDEWMTTQASSKYGKKSIFKDNSISPQVLLQGTAKKLELDLAKLVEQDTSDQPHGKLYLRMASDLRKRLIDHPLEQLKSAVLSSHTAKYVHVVMNPKDYGAEISRIQPTEIEVVHAMSDMDFVPEPPQKQICHGVRNISPTLAAAPLWFGLVNGKPGRFQLSYV
jgi:hypothetical protein